MSMSSLSLVLRAIEDLSSNRVSKDTDNLLIAWLKTDDAWSHLIHLFNQNIHTHIATICLRQKILYDFTRLTPQEATQIQQTVFQLLQKHKHEPPIVTQLALCYADIAIHMADTWKNPVTDLLQILSNQNDNQDSSSILEVLNALPEELKESRLLHRHNRNALHSKNLKNASTQVLNLLANLKNPNNRTLELASRCLGNWFSFCSAATEEIKNITTHPLIINTCLQALDHSPVYSECLLSLVQQLNKWQLSLFKNEKQQHASFLEEKLTLFTRILSPCMAVYSETFDKEIQSNLALIICEMARGLMSNIVENVTQFEKLLHCVLEMTQPTRGFIEERLSGDFEVLKEHFAAVSFWRLLQMRFLKQIRQQIESMILAENNNNNNNNNENNNNNGDCLFDEEEEEEEEDEEVFEQGIKRELDSLCNVNSQILYQNVISNSTKIANKNNNTSSETTKVMVDLRRLVSDSLYNDFSGGFIPPATEIMHCEALVAMLKLCVLPIEIPMVETVEKQMELESEMEKLHFLREDVAKYAQVIGEYARNPLDFVKEVLKLADFFPSKNGHELALFGIASLLQGVATRVNRLHVESCKLTEIIELSAKTTGHSNNSAASKEALDSSLYYYYVSDAFLLAEISSLVSNPSEFLTQDSPPETALDAAVRTQYLRLLSHTMWLHKVPSCEDSVRRFKLVSIAIMSQLLYPRTERESKAIAEFLRISDAVNDVPQVVIRDSPLFAVREAAASAYEELVVSCTPYPLISLDGGAILHDLIDLSLKSKHVLAPMLYKDVIASTTHAVCFLRGCDSSFLTSFERLVASPVEVLQKCMHHADDQVIKEALVANSFGKPKADQVLRQALLELAAVMKKTSKCLYFKSKDLDSLILNVIWPALEKCLIAFEADSLVFERASRILRHSILIVQPEMFFEQIGTKLLPIYVHGFVNYAHSAVLFACDWLAVNFLHRTEIQEMISVLSVIAAHILGFETQSVPTEVLKSCPTPQVAPLINPQEAAWSEIAEDLFGLWCHLLKEFPSFVMNHALFPYILKIAGQCLTLELKHHPAEDIWQLIEYSCQLSGIYVKEEDYVQPDLGLVDFVSNYVGGDERYNILVLGLRRERGAGEEPAENLTRRMRDLLLVDGGCGVGGRLVVDLVGYISSGRCEYMRVAEDCLWMLDRSIGCFGFRVWFLGSLRSGGICLGDDVLADFEEMLNKGEVRMVCREFWRRARHLNRRTGIINSK